VLEAEMPGENAARNRVAEFAEHLAPMDYELLAFEFDGSLRVGALGAFPLGHANVAFVHRSRNDFRHFLAR
jgi:hypothetical protein